ncbi:MAG TPA: hypothetical protein PKW86_09465 [bacterium]|nr:hypothetical protein [bacterium]HOL36080.1 hypothetical protein [bacterium]
MLRLVIAVSILVASGCAILQTDIPPSHPDFFVCNWCVDRNQNGKIDDGEWEGIKDDFRECEHISFVGYFHQKPGTELAFKLIGPDGSIYKQKSLKQTAKTTIWCQEYEAKDLVNACGAGMWTIEWYAGGKLVNITAIRILKNLD